ncbi:uncharacterized protein LOC115078859 [Rhinatrema bivittatum]|uniref:uncharacterized protein LOC115078859 n=1 Tax=Rhinatrema bivittatum TaxID=194408 RepID=UPI00112A34A4|nr:uncharacterized protein LOC115078859 [Rhinatrema bivittatum]
MPGPGASKKAAAQLLLALLIAARQPAGWADDSCGPVVVYPKSSLSLPPGSTLLLNCTVQACPGNGGNLTVTWGRLLSGRYDDLPASQAVRYHRRREETLEVVTLRIPRLTPQHQGLYQCRAVEGESVAIGHIVSVHLTNVSQMNSSQIEMDDPQLGYGLQLSDSLFIAGGLLGTALLLLAVSSLLWRFWLRDLLRARSLAPLRTLQSDPCCDEEVTYTTLTISQKPWPGGTFVRTPAPQGSCEYAALRHQLPPPLPAPRTAITSGNHCSPG